MQSQANQQQTEAKKQQRLLEWLQRLAVGLSLITHLLSISNETSQLLKRAPKEVSEPVENRCIHDGQSDQLNQR